MYLKEATKHQPFPGNKLYMRANTPVCETVRERDKKREWRREGGGNDLRDYWPKGMSCQDSPAHKHSIVPLVHCITFSLQTRI